MPNVSLGTIYRNLKTLVEMGEVQELRTEAATHAMTERPTTIIILCEQCGR